MNPRGNEQSNRRRRRSPIDTVLGPQLPPSPQTTGTATGGTGSPVDSALASDDNGGATASDPWTNPFMEVYEKTKVGALENLADIQKQMSESFAHKGGYFGGKHAVSQGEVAARTGSYLDQLLAETELGATKMQYEDWKRGREETISLANLIPTLIDSELFQNIVQMPGQGKGSAAGSLLGTGAGAFAGGAGSAIGGNVGGNVGGKGGN